MKFIKDIFLDPNGKFSMTRFLSFLVAISGIVIAFIGVFTNNWNEAVILGLVGIGIGGKAISGFSGS